MPEAITSIPINKLSISEFNVRKAGKHQDIDELTSNIAEIGVKSPLIVEKRNDGKFEIVAGQRRYIAAKNASLKTVPCIIRSYESDIDRVIESFSENIFRSDMTLDDKANATKMLMKHFDNDKRQVAKAIGAHTVTVDKYLEIYSLPEILKQAVRTKKMNFETAKTIYKKTKYDQKQMKRLVESYISKNNKEKTDYYAAIKIAKNVDDIDEEFNKIVTTEKTTLRLPTTDNNFIQKIAKEKKMVPEMVLLNLVMAGIYEYKRGKVRF